MNRLQRGVCLGIVEPARQFAARVKHRGVIAAAEVFSDPFKAERRQLARQVHRHATRQSDVPLPRGASHRCRSQAEMASRGANNVLQRGLSLLGKLGDHTIDAITIDTLAIDARSFNLLR